MADFYPSEYLLINADTENCPCRHEQLEEVANFPLEDVTIEMQKSSHEFCCVQER